MSKDKINDLFRKIIASLVSIETISHNEEIKKEANNYLNDLVHQYYDYVQKSTLTPEYFKNKVDDIDNFSYKCINERKDDLMRLAEDLQHGILELQKLITKEKDK